MPIDKSHVDVFYKRHPYYKELIAHIHPDDFGEKSVVKWLLEGFGLGNLSIMETRYTKRLLAELTKHRGGFPIRLPTFRRLTENALKRLIVTMRLRDKMDHEEIATLLNIHPATARKVVNEVDRGVYDPPDSQ